MQCRVINHAWLLLLFLQQAGQVQHAHRHVTAAVVSHTAETVILQLLCY
jgi:hypothetical protein